MPGRSVYAGSRKQQEVRGMKEILKLEHIQKYYGNQGNLTKAIQDISFSVREGEFLGIMGSSGSGASVKIRLS